MFDLVGQDGPYTVAVKATDDNGAFDVDTATVNVTNVAPSVLNLASNGPKDEGEAITVTGTISDPGWLEALTATIDWGDGTGVQAIAGGTLENVRPDATLSFSVSHSYGDDSGAGTFTATVCGLDDDTSTCAPIALTITNEPPDGGDRPDRDGADQRHPDVPRARGRARAVHGQLVRSRERRPHDDVGLGRRRPEPGHVDALAERRARSIPTRIRVRRSIRGP